jgi:hypothetical protein
VTELAVDVIPGGQILDMPAAYSGSTARREPSCLRFVDRALDRQPHVGHLIPDPGRRLSDPHVSVGCRVLRLDDLLLGAELLELPDIACPR